MDMGRIFADPGSRRRGGPEADQCLGLSHGKMVSDDSAVGFNPAFRVRKAEQGPGMPLGDLVDTHGVQHRLGQFEQPDQV